MALQAKIIQVTYTQQSGTDENGDPVYTDLSLVGRFQVRVDYFDSGNPANVLHTTTFDFPYNVTTQDAVVRVQEYGAQIRDARARVVSLQSQIGATINIP